MDVHWRWQHQGSKFNSCFQVIRVAVLLKKLQVEVLIIDLGCFKFRVQRCLLVWMIFTRLVEYSSPVTVAAAYSLLVSWWKSMRSTWSHVDAYLQLTDLNSINLTTQAHQTTTKVRRRVFGSTSTSMSTSPTCADVMCQYWEGLCESSNVHRPVTVCIWEGTCDIHLSTGWSRA